MAWATWGYGPLGGHTRYSGEFCQQFKPPWQSTWANFIWTCCFEGGSRWNTDTTWLIDSALLRDFFNPFSLSRDPIRPTMKSYIFAIISTGPNWADYITISFIIWRRSFLANRLPNEHLPPGGKHPCFGV